MEPYTWDNLTTVAGASAATLLIVQYVKLPLQKTKVPTRLVALLVAFTVMICAHAFGSAGLRPGDVPLIAVNAFLVALSAMGAYESTFRAGDDAIWKLRNLKTANGTAGPANAAQAAIQTEVAIEQTEVATALAEDDAAAQSDPPTDPPAP